MYYDEKTAARLINSMFSSIDDSRPALKKAWIDAAGNMCACDGFRAYRLHTPVAGVPDQDAEKGIDLDKIFPADMYDYKPLELPTLADVRCMIEEDKRTKKRDGAASFVFTFGLDESGEQLPAVNLNYLADALQMFPNALAYYKSPVAPIVFKDENGDALVLPIRIMNDNGQGIDATKRRQAIPQPKKDKTPALGLRTFAAIYAV